MRLELHKAIRPGSPQERRRKLRDVLPLLEQAHDNGWRWPDILEMAREMLGEPEMTLYALKNIRRRYKSLLSPAASNPSFSGAPAQPVPAPIAPPVEANAAEAPVQSPGESAIARARRLQQQDKTSAALAAPHSLSGRAPRTVARRIEEIAQALEADSDMLNYPVMGPEEALALAQDLENGGMLKLAAREFAQYCFDRIFPIYESMDRPLIQMRTDVGRWGPVVAGFACARRPYGEFILTLVYRINPKATMEGKGFSGTAAHQIMTLIREKNL